MAKFLQLLTGAVFALVFVSAADAQIRRGFDKVPEITEAQAEEVWDTFKGARLAGDYVFEFEITHSPRRGEDVAYVGEMYGSERGGGKLTRIRVKKAGEPDSAYRDFILENSSAAQKVWTVKDGAFAEVPTSQWMKPLVDGLIFSPFDLLMPYVNWARKYARAGRVGQAVYFFDLPAPDNFGENVSKVELAITREFNSPAQTRIFAKDGKTLKTVSLGSVKKVDGVWIVLELSARDEISRDKDKLKFRAANLRTVVDSAVFDPSQKPSQPPRRDMKKL